MKIQYRITSALSKLLPARRIPIGYTFAGGKVYKPNGAREVMRRRLQIADGILQPSK